METEGYRVRGRGAPNSRIQSGQPIAYKNYTFKDLNLHESCPLKKLD